MNRRGFLARILAAPIVALTVLRASSEPQWIRDLVAFGTPEPSNLGISIRFIRSFDIDKAQHATRFDVLYGMAQLQPSLAVEQPWWSLRRWFRSAA